MKKERISRPVVGRLPQYYSCVEELYLSNCIRVSSATLSQRLGYLLEQTRLAVDYKGEYVALKEARKHAAWYLKGVHGAARLRGRTGSLKTLSDLENLIQDALEEEQKAAFPQ